MHDPTVHLICVIVGLTLLALAGLGINGQHASTGWWDLFFLGLAFFVF